MMKKSMAAALAMVFALSMAFTSFAAANTKAADTKTAETAKTLTVAESAIEAVRPDIAKMNLGEITEDLIDLSIYSEEDQEELIVALFTVSDGQYLLFGVYDNASGKSDLFVGKLNEKNTVVSGKTIAFKDVEDINDKEAKVSFSIKDNNIVFTDGSKQKAELATAAEMAAMIKEFEKLTK